MNIKKQLVKLEKLDSEYKRRKQALDTAKNLLDVQKQKVLQYLLENKLQNLSDDAVTVYQETHTIPIMENKVEFVRYAVEHEAWDLLPASVSSVAWRRIIETEPVPGVRKERKVKFGMRRK